MFDTLTRGGASGAGGTYEIDKSLRFDDFSLTFMYLITEFLNSKSKSDRISAPSSESIFSIYLAIS